MSTSRKQLAPAHDDDVHTLKSFILSDPSTMSIVSGVTESIVSSCIRESGEESSVDAFVGGLPTMKNSNRNFDDQKNIMDEETECSTVRDLKHENEELLVALEDTSAEHEATSHELEKLQRDYETLQTQFDNFRNDTKILFEEMDEMREQVTLAEEFDERLHHVKSQAKQRIDEITKEKVHAQNELKKMLLKLDSAQDELTKVLLEKKTLKNENNALRRRVKKCTCTSPTNITQLLKGSSDSELSVNAVIDSAPSRTAGPLDFMSSFKTNTRRSSTNGGNSNTDSTFGILQGRLNLSRRASMSSVTCVMLESSNLIENMMNNNDDKQESHKKESASFDKVSGDDSSNPTNARSSWFEKPHQSDKKEDLSFSDEPFINATKEKIQGCTTSTTMGRRMSLSSFAGFGYKKPLSVSTEIPVPSKQDKRPSAIFQEILSIETDEGKLLEGW